ncbi:MAG: hypothetical protein ACRD5L_01885 [Bryobacteraceae bacterium]
MGQPGKTGKPLGKAVGNPEGSALGSTKGKALGRLLGKPGIAVGMPGKNGSAVRAIGFGIGVGLVATALRIWLSLERGSYFDAEL